MSRLKRGNFSWHLKVVQTFLFRLHVWSAFLLLLIIEPKTEVFEKKYFNGLLHYLLRKQNWVKIFKFSKRSRRERALPSFSSLCDVTPLILRNFLINVIPASILKAKELGCPESKRVKGRKKRTRKQISTLKVDFFTRSFNPHPLLHFNLEIMTI